MQQLLLIFVFLCQIVFSMRTNIYQPGQRLSITQSQLSAIYTTSTHYHCHHHYFSSSQYLTAFELLVNPLYQRLASQSLKWYYHSAYPKVEVTAMTHLILSSTMSPRKELQQVKFLHFKFPKECHSPEAKSLYPY